MTTTSKRLITLGAAALLAAASATGAYAWGGFGPGGGKPCWGGPGGGGGPGAMRGMGGGPGWMMADPAYTEQALTEQKTQLGITADQEAAWNAYQEAVKAQSGLRASHRQMWLAGPVTAEQRFNMRQQGLEQMQKLNQASRDLYGALTPEQQSRADTLLGFGGGRRWGPWQ